jgi:branched-chain amino acid transport system permease protein
MSGRFSTEYSQQMRLVRTKPQRWVTVAVVVFLVLFPFFVNADLTPPFGFPWTGWAAVANFAMLGAIGAAAFNLLVGYTGQISLAHAAFLIVGTMVAGWFGHPDLWGWSFWIVIPLAGIIGALVGALVGLPALRLKGLYLLLATLGVHYASVLLFDQFTVRYFGFTGIQFDPPTIPSWLHWLPGITPDEFTGQFEIKGEFRWYWLLLPVTALSLLFMVNLVRSREGRAFAAIKERDVSASLIGINVARSKLLSFAVSSAFVSMSGALFAYYLGGRGEGSFTVQTVLNYAIMIVVGGFAGIQGAVFGAVFFYAAPVLFDWVRAEFPVLRNLGFLTTYKSEINLAVFGLLIVVVLVLRPEGIAGIWKAIKGYFRKWPYSI